MTDKATIEAALLTAGKEAQRGVKEEGPNRGQRVETYLKSVGLGPGYPWCAAFVNWSLREAGYSAGPVSGATIAWRNWAKKANRLMKAGKGIKRGDLFGWTNGDGTGHIGWVAEVKFIGPVMRIRTVEGNTNKEGSREGDRVLSKWRTPTGKYWFINLVGA